MASVPATEGVQNHHNLRSRLGRFFTRELRKSLVVSMITGIIGIVVVYLVSNKPLSDALDANMANAFLGTLAQVIAGTVAIVFTVSTLAVTIASDRYSSQLTAKFIYDPLTVTTFLLLLLCGTVAVISIGVSYPMYQWGFLAMAFLFIFCVTMLLFYLIHTVSFMKPEGLATDLLEEGRQAFRDQDYEKLERVITSLGDIILKAFDRGEDAVAKLYLQSLARLQQHWLEQGQPVERRDAGYASLGFGKRSPIFNQYRRVLKSFTTRGDEDLSETINALASESILNLMDRSESIEALKGLLSQYNDFVDLVVENKSPARFGFLHSFRDMIWKELDYRRKTHSEKYASISKFVEVNRIMIEHADQELWQHVLSFFCSGHQSVDDLTQTFNYSVSNLLSATDHIDYDWFMGWRFHVDRILSPHMSTSAHNMLKRLLGGLEQKLPDDANARNQLGFLIQYSYELYVSQHLIHAFFQIGFEAFKLKKYDYLEQLWKTQHGHPDLERVPSDIAFNIIMIYRYVSPPAFIAHRPDEIVMFTQYCFLYLSYSLQKCQQAEWVPVTPLFSGDQLNTDNELAHLLKKELESTYHLLINLPHVMRELLPAYETLKPAHNAFDSIFDGKATEALEKAYEWLNDLPFAEKWEKATEDIILSLPIDPVKQEHLKQAVQDGYLTSTKLKSLTRVVSELSSRHESEEIFVPEPKGIFVREHIDKVDLTFLGSDRFDGHIGFQIASLEKNLLVTTILNEASIEHQSVQQLNFNAIEEAVKKLQDSDMTPTILMITFQDFHNLWNSDPVFRSKIANDSYGNRILKVNTEVELSVLDDLGTNANKIIIFSTDLGELRELSPLDTDIEPCPENPLKLHVGSKKGVSYEVSHPAAGIIVDIETL